jgi:hypothetical protein
MAGFVMAVGYGNYPQLTSWNNGMFSPVPGSTGAFGQPYGVNQYGQTTNGLDQAMAAAPDAGMPWGGMSAGFSMGTALGNAYNSYAAARQQQRQREHAKQISARNMTALIGAQIGDIVGNAQNVVGGHDDPRSRYMSTNTAVATSNGNPLAASGGMNPLVVAARRRIYNMLQGNQYGDAYRNAMSGAQSRQLGQQYAAGQAPMQASLRDAFGALLQQGQAGVGAAGIQMQADAMRRQQGQQAGQQGLQFLNQLYGSASGLY